MSALTYNLKKPLNRSLKLASILMLAATIQGCAVATVVAITTGASMATDRRSVGNQIDDQSIEFSAHNELAKQKSLTDNTNLHIVSVNASVLIVGQAPNTYLRDLAVKTVTQVKGINQVHNQIRIGSTTSITTQTNDIWLTSKVKSALFASDKINGKDIKVITENGEVFLLGLVTKEEANTAIDITRNISGVSRVFNAFEHI
jgi:osmotically-inducible protein OsmY